MRVVRHRVKTYPDVARNVPKDTKLVVSLCCTLAYSVSGTPASKKAH